MAEKVWFITGATSGFGRIWAEAALQRGDEVVATGRSTDRLAELRDSFGDAVLPIPLDVTDRPAVFAAMRAAVERFGRVDVVLSAAGYSYQGAVEELDFDAAKANFETNYFGTLSVLQAALPILRNQGSGHILTVSSIGGILSLPTSGAYGASKFALEAMSEALAGEIADLGINVTIVEPGVYATGFGSAAKTPEQIDAYAPVRTAIRATFDPTVIGDPAATSQAILAAVDAPAPPLRLILGDWVLDRFKTAYQDRITTWEQWADTSNAAQR